jgi:GH15 family glucan-1,4-alpha-glucosidase
VSLAERSVEVILAGQSPSGGYVASPAFEQYRYSWFRDGSFIADGMSRAGQLESAERFFDWCAAVVRARPDGPWDSRYRLDGSPDDSEWPHHQLDGLGLWVWAARGHCERHGVESRWADACELTVSYLRAHWRNPCVDWWEEREGVHAATVGSIWAATRDDRARDFVTSCHEQERLDGSHAFLVALGLAPVEHLERIERELGYHRHADDEYYGGGSWIILAGFTGWARVACGLDASAQLEWIEAQATPAGELPEQVPPLLRPERYDPWVEKWGAPPLPLLWSHAMYLTLRSVMGL